ncbi:H-NS family nucleoid-associated regulatory protein [Paraburkholderia sp.]|uniref:H-NS histone family protein n=1 Tax=Paraburkholderia sp. TaxID=1926495 RepID=UPI003D6EA779
MATLEQIQTRMKKLQVQAEKIIARRAQAALDQIRSLMIKHGLTTEDIESRAKARRERARGEANGAAKSAKTAKGAPKGKLPPKYLNPKTGETWSGHARPPAWIKDVKDRSKFLIAGAAHGAATVSKAAAKSGKVAKKVTAKKVAGKKSAAKKAKAVGAKKAAVKKTAKKTGRAKAAPVKKAAAKKVSAKKASAAPATAPVAASAAA